MSTYVSQRCDPSCGMTHSPETENGQGPVLHVPFGVRLDVHGDLVRLRGDACEYHGDDQYDDRLASPCPEAIGGLPRTIPTTMYLCCLFSVPTSRNTSVWHVVRMYSMRDDCG